jgi:hypothetical protein
MVDCFKIGAEKHDKEQGLLLSSALFLSSRSVDRRCAMRYSRAIKTRSPMMRHSADVSERLSAAVRMR